MNEIEFLRNSFNVNELVGETFETIKKFLNVSHGTVVRDNQLATKSFASYFGYVIWLNQKK